jgi:galactarate dehydratase
MTEKPIIIKAAKADNVGIVANLNGLPKGTFLDDGTILSENIPSGHKVALSNVSKGDKIIRYGQIIGYANKQIMQGECINESKVSLPQPPDLDSIPLTDNHGPALEPLKGYTYAVNSIPANFLLDETGTIIAKDLRGEELYNKVNEVLGVKK